MPLHFESQPALRTATYQARTRAHSDQHSVACLAAREFLLIAAFVVKALEYQAMDGVDSVEAAHGGDSFLDYLVGAIGLGRANARNQEYRHQQERLHECPHDAEA